MEPLKDLEAQAAGRGEVPLAVAASTGASGEACTRAWDPFRCR
jgi:hypothetical protein